MADNIRYYRDGDLMDDSGADMYALVFWLENDVDPVPFSISCIDIRNIENPLQLQDPNVKDDIPVTIKGQEDCGKFIQYGRVFMIGGTSFHIFLLHSNLYFIHCNFRRQT